MNEDYYTIDDLINRFKGRVSGKSWRREIASGRLSAIRARPSANSRLLISESALQGWLENFASKRAVVRSTPSVPVATKMSTIKRARRHDA